MKSNNFSMDLNVNAQLRQMSQHLSQIIDQNRTVIVNRSKVPECIKSQSLFPEENADNTGQYFRHVPDSLMSSNPTFFKESQEKTVRFGADPGASPDFDDYSGYLAQQRQSRTSSRAANEEIADFSRSYFVPERDSADSCIVRAFRDFCRLNHIQEPDFERLIKPSYDQRDRTRSFVFSCINATFQGLRQQINLSKNQLQETLQKSQIEALRAKSAQSTQSELKQRYQLLQKQFKQVLSENDIQKYQIDKMSIRLQQLNSQLINDLAHVSDSAVQTESPRECTLCGTQRNSSVVDSNQAVIARLAAVVCKMRLLVAQQKKQDVQSILRREKEPLFRAYQLLSEDYAYQIVSKNMKVLLSEII